jgi:hypothetical protein
MRMKFRISNTIWISEPTVGKYCKPLNEKQTYTRKKPDKTAPKSRKMNAQTRCSKIDSGLDAVFNRRLDHLETATNGIKYNPHFDVVAG